MRSSGAIGTPLRIRQFSTRSAVAEASLSPSTAKIVINGYTTEGDAPPATFRKAKSGEEAIPGVIASADGAKWVFDDADVIDARHLGVSGAASGSVAAVADLIAARKALVASSVIPLTRLGCRPGSDISTRLNEAIRCAGPGTAFLIPPLDGDVTANRWIADAPIEMKTGITLQGEGYDDRAGSALFRTGAFPLIRAHGDGGGVAATAMVRNIGFHRLLLDGLDQNETLIDLLNVATLRMSYTKARAVGVGHRVMFIRGQVQDSSWLSCRWENGGSDDGTVPAVDIDDSASPAGGHNQNLLFLDNTWEAYNGRAIWIHGESAEGLRNSLMHFLSCKVEGLTRSNVPDVVLDQCNNIVFDFRLLMSRGDVGQTKAALVQLNNSERIRVNGVFAHLAGGASLANVIQTANTVNTDIDIRISDTNTVNGLTGTSIVTMNTTSGNNARCDYLGTSGAKKQLTNVEQRVSVTNRVSLIETINSVFARITRTNAAGAAQSSNRLIAAVNAANTRYVGLDANNHLAGGDGADLTGAALWKLDNDSGEVRANGGVRVGSATGPTWTSGTGSPEGVVTAPIGSLYTDTNGGAGTTLYAKESGSGNTGWAAK